MTGEVWHVLVVDDNADDREQVRRLLARGSERRLTFAEAETAAAGVRACLTAAAPPHCVVLDYDLPDGTAPDVLAALRAGGDLPVCPVVVLTGGAGHEATRAILRAGAQDYVGKTWLTAEGLARAVENAVERHALSRELADREAAFRESELLLRQLADASPAMLWVTDPTGTCTFLSAGWYEFTGQTEETGLGYGWLDAVHPDDRDAALSQFAAANETREPFQLDFRLRRADGEYRWAIDAGRPRYGPSGFLGFVGSVIDIADRKRAEQQLRRSEEFARSVVASSPDCVKILDLSGRLLWMNDRGRQLFEICDFEAIKNTDYAGLWADQAARRDAAAAGGAARAGGVGRFRGFCPTLAGTPKWWDVAITPIPGPDGRPEQLIAVSRDVTEQRTAEEALREADRRKDEFLATLAHELRNPLAPIRTGLQILKLRPGGEPADKARSMMERQLGHMVRLIDDLLDISRVSRGKVELRRKLVSVRAVVESAVEASRPAIEEAGHRLAVRTPDEPLHLDADPTRLAQVLSNLLNNAAKYTPAGGQVSLCAERRGGDVVVCVTDTGVGIPCDDLPKVFDLFTQVGRNLDRAQGGLGIGLSLVKKLVEMHGGSVRADSPGAGLGSTFEVRLPLAPAPAPEAQDPSANGHRPAAGRRHRVLVVDDNADGADSLAMLLTLPGHTVRTAYSGPDALTVAADFRPDVVVLDIGLPGMDGYEVARRLRQDPDLGGATLVALTGWGSEADKKRATDAGFDAHLTKPVDPAQLAALLSDLPIGAAVARSAHETPPGGASERAARHVV